MKKSIFIFLTFIASLSVTISSAQTDPVTNNYPSNYLLEIDKLYANSRDTTKRDTVHRDSTYVNSQQVVYNNNYYYQNRFFNSLFRVFFPVRYNYLISRPGYVPRTRRGEGRVHHHTRGPSSHKRGGFGYTGSHHSQHN